MSDRIRRLEEENASLREQLAAALAGIEVRDMHLRVVQEDLAELRRQHRSQKLDELTRLSQSYDPGGYH